MLQNNLRCVDESQNGAGPFWTLCKDPKEANWKADRYHEFFTLMLSELAQGKRFTPEQLTASAQQYLKTHEKRALKIEKHTSKKSNGVADLVQWLERGAGSE
jgi:hypothetical protein